MAHHNIDLFKKERLNALRTENAPIGLAPSAALIAMHIIPETMSAVYDISPFYGEKGRSLIPLLSLPQGSHFIRRYNVHGIISAAPNGQQFGALSFLQQSYLQLFRSGTIESVNGEYINTKTRSIPIAAITNGITEQLFSYLETLASLGVNEPCYVMISILGVKGYTLAVSSGCSQWDDSHEIDHNDLLLPAIIVRTSDSKEHIAKTLRYPLDVLWNAGGYPHSQQPYTVS